MTGATVLIAVLGGAVRSSTPYLLVSLGECVTERSGRTNLGQEGILVLGAMVGYAGSYRMGNAWAGVFAAGLAGMAMGALHALACQLRRVNDVAVGIALILFGTGLAFLFGKPYIQPAAPMLPSLPLGWWAPDPAVRAALDVNALFLLGIALAVAMHLVFQRTRWGLILRTDIVITTVPASDGLVPFLDPSWLKPDAFVSSVDVGRSWMDAGIGTFDVLATDAIAQTDIYPGAGNHRFHVDLVELAGAADRRRGGRAMFCFKGFAIADLVVAELIYQAARHQGIGTTLPR